jgi:dipeptidyl aminopeptidase/acylaminoacyl peptidase
MKLALSALLAMAANSAAPDPVVLPGVVSTAASEIRLAISPDGRMMLWGSVGRDADRGQLDIWQRRRVGDGWSEPTPVPFNTPGEDFDPAFSPDGRQVYFHSDRPGGYGASDLYVVDLDPATGSFGAPRNLGPKINSKGAEWAPTPTPDGRLIFASDGWGGFGKHDLFVADLKGGKAENLGAAINGPDEDFDAAVAPDGQAMVFSSGTVSDDAEKVALFVSRLTAEGWSTRTPAGVGCSGFVNGPGFDPSNPDRFFYSARCEGGQGRMDIRETRSPIR